MYIKRAPHWLARKIYKTEDGTPVWRCYSHTGLSMVIDAAGQAKLVGSRTLSNIESPTARAEAANKIWTARCVLTRRARLEAELATLNTDLAALASSAR